MNKEFNSNNPEAIAFIKEIITEMFIKFHSKDYTNMVEEELEVCRSCEHYYPNDPTKQESLAYCVMYAILETDPLNLNIVSEDKIMPLAIKLGVEDALAQEIMNIRNKKILGEEVN